MINLVLQHLDRLHSDLAAIDPLQDIAAADRVADIAKDLRNTLNGLAKSDGTLSRRLTQLNQVSNVKARAA